jgi:hypothetical protein
MQFLHAAFSQDIQKFKVVAILFKIECRFQENSLIDIENNDFLIIWKRKILIRDIVN